MKIFAIVNPMSGAGMDTSIAGRRVAMIRDELQRRGLDGSIRVTERPGHARDLASAAADDRVDLVLAWGGGAPVNEVRSGLIGCTTARGLIPAGPGNASGRAWDLAPAGSRAGPGTRWTDDRHRCRRRSVVACSSTSPIGSMPTPAVSTNATAAVAGGCPILSSACAKGRACRAALPNHLGWRVVGRPRSRAADRVRQRR